MIRLPLLVVAALVAVLPAAAAAQSSIFGIRALGVPSRALSARATGTGGGYGYFDAESGMNPAAIGGIGTLTTVFTGMQEFRSSTSLGGTGDVRTARFPHIMIVGPVPGKPLAVSVGVSAYTDRDFALTSADTALIRGQQVIVSDTVLARGGLNDVGLRAAWVRGGSVALGVGFHFITGSVRQELRRGFDNGAFLPTTQRAQISYNGIGVSAGAMVRVRGNLFAAAQARVDGSLQTYRDELALGTIALPATFGVGLRWQPLPRLDIAGFAQRRSWGRADSSLVAQGAAGATDTWDAAFGFEWLRDARFPWQRPLRLGARYGTLPFFVTRGQQPREYALSAGTGFRFANGRGGIDLSLERVWRDDGTGRRESGWLIGAGVSVRP
ncbi:MAG: hypothetical protein NW201_03635 [Gemmatimonadales bacterium]|nr:hypothetical protein [Gemmatimonadales bacterium]